MNRDTEISKQLFELAAMEIKINDIKKRAFEIVKAKCGEILANKEAMHEAYKALNVSTSELRTIVSDGTVYFVDDAIKIVKRDLLSRQGE